MTLFLGALILSFVTLRLPAVQQLLGLTISRMLTDELRDAGDRHTSVHVGSVNASLMLRIVLDDVCVIDRQSDTLLTATRLATRLRFIPLLSGSISLSHVQLYGPDIRLKQSADGQLNCQYLIDKLTGDGNGDGGTDFEITTILLRRGYISLMREVDATQSTDTASTISASDLSATVYGLRIQDKTFSIYLRDLHFSTDYGHFDNLSARVSVSPDGGFVRALSLAMVPHADISAATSLTIDSAAWRTDFKEWQLYGGRATLLAADIPPTFIKQDKVKSLLSHFDHAKLTFAAHGSADSLVTDTLMVTAPNVRATADATVTFSPLNIDLRALNIYYEGTENAQLTASGTYTSNQGSLNAALTTNFADIKITGSVDEKGLWHADCLAEHLKPAHLASYFDSWDWLSENLGESASAEVRLHGHGNIHTQAIGAEGEITCNSTPVACKLKGTVQRSITAGTTAHVDGNIDRLRPQALGAKGRLATRTYSADVALDAQLPMGGDVDNVTGRVMIGHLSVLDDSLICGELLHGFLAEIIPASENSRRLSVYSDFMTMHALSDGSLTNVVKNIRHHLAKALPSLIDAPPIADTISTNKNKIALNAQLWDTRLINYLSAADLQICDTLQLHISSAQTLSLSVQSDSVHIGKEKLSQIQLDASVSDTGLRLSADMYRAMHTGNTHLQLKAGAMNDTIDTNLQWRVYENDFVKPNAMEFTPIAEARNRKPEGNDFVKQNAMEFTPIAEARNRKPEGNDFVKPNEQSNACFDSAMARNRKPEGNLANDSGEANYGSMKVQALLGDTMQIVIFPSQIMLSGTPWSVKHSSLTLMPGGVLDVERVVIESDERYLHLDGRLSSVATDTLRATLNKVNLGYIFDMVNFHSVELDGDAIGVIYATGLTTNPRADGKLLVTNFAFNNDILGDMNLAAHWDTDEGQLDVYGDITGPDIPSATRFGNPVHNHTIISGRINPIQNTAVKGLDLQVAAQGFSLGFLNMWTEGIFEDIQGSLTGNVRIFGPFSGVDLDGTVVIDHCVGHVPTLGNVNYQFGGDTIQLRPGLFQLQGLQLFDKHAASRRPGHSATINGRITHQHFNHMNFDLSAETINLLGFNTREFGDEVFYGTAYLTGNVHLNGAPGRLNVDISGTTQRGSMLVYNSTTPDAVTNSNFLTFVDNLDTRRTNTITPTVKTEQFVTHYDNSADINLHFNIHVTPETSLRVLMDQRSGDYIELQGTAPLQCSYYNKGTLRMYGTYEVERGRYRMTLQDFIRKEFTFSQGGTISFLGRPAEAKLDLQAVYPVSGVNLNDLAATATFSSTRTRVNCLMNLTGTALAPQVSFDFDLPNASSDEQQMVKSLVSTEEERNLQAIYLLGLGNFYVQDNATTTTRGNMAVNSFLSSTLSSQINTLLGNVIGSKNWQVGTNISTGQMGWDEVQAEGSLSGRLFHDRLLVNGTFGYREGTTTNQTGFIGDFDARWLLTPKGTISIKAYSQTTDRYFTKSALTTQGLGIVLQKDFSSLRDLFNLKLKKKTESGEE